MNANRRKAINSIISQIEELVSQAETLRDAPAFLSPLFHAGANIMKTRDLSIVRPAPEPIAVPSLTAREAIVILGDMATDVVALLGALDKKAGWSEAERRAGAIAYRRRLAALDTATRALALFGQDRPA